MAEVETIYRGGWWRPGAPEDVQYGALRIMPTGEIQLELAGGFDDSVKTPLPDGTGYSVGPGDGFDMLLGVCGNEDFTLLSCSTRSSKGLFGIAPHDHILGVQVALRGINLESPDQLAFDGIEIEYDYLLTWSAMTTMQGSIQLEENKGWNGHSEAKSAPVEKKVAKYGPWDLSLQLRYTAFDAKMVDENTRTSPRWNMRRYVWSLQQPSIGPDSTSRCVACRTCLR
jgi:hypothetical protein